MSNTMDANVGTEAKIGTTTRNGQFVITDTSWDGNGTLNVTVREQIGQDIDARDIRAMRDLARRALMYPEKTRSARVIRRSTAYGCRYVTFAVSRLPR